MRWRFPLAMLLLGLSAFTMPAQDSNLWKAYSDGGWRACRANDLKGGRELLESALKEADSFPADDPRRALTLSYLAFLSLKEGLTADADQHAKAAWNIYQKNQLAGHLAGVNALALVFQHRQQHEQAEAVYKKLLKAEEAAVGKQHPIYGQVQRNLARLYQDQGRYAEAEAQLLQALKALDQPTEAVQARLVQGLHQIGGLYRQWGKPSLAMPYLERAVRIRALSPGELELASSLDELGAAYFQQGHLLQAEEVWQRALRLREKALAEKPLQEQGPLALSLHNVGVLRLEQKNWEAARASFQRALGIREQLLGKDDARLGGTLDGLAEAAFAQQRRTDAEAYWRRALALREKALGPNHLDTAATHESLGRLYSQSQAGLAEQHFRRALEIKEANLGATHRAVAATLHNLANFYRDAGKLDAAAPLYQRALASKEKTYGPDDPALLPLLDNYAALLRKQLKPIEAAKLAERAKAIRSLQ